jgi:2-polyprenyl-3-methyl-5-hydroxy-6-metoxy-1,4-benzoquinol methylase
VLDEKKTEDFADKLMDVLNGGALALMTSIGHRTGLFDAMDDRPPLTSAELADRAGLDERYVREWLGAMFTAGVVDYDPATRRYVLPAEHAAWLTRDAAPNNLAAMAQYIGLLGTVEDQVVDCFRNGGGVPYSAFPRFQEVMAEDSGQTVLPALVDSILPLVPGLTDALERGIDVLDIGCGRGQAMLLLAETFPASRFRGYDLSEEAVAAANEDARARGLTNIRFAAKDLVAVAETERYDLVTAFDVIHDQVRPDVVLSMVRQALRPGGVFLMQDIQGSCHVEKNRDHPLGTILYTISTMHCMTVSLAEGGAGLGTMWGEETAVRMLEEAGFGNVTKQRLEHDPQNTYYVVRKA